MVTKAQAQAFQSGVGVQRVLPGILAQEKKEREIAEERERLRILEEKEIREQQVAQRELNEVLRYIDLLNRYSKKGGYAFIDVPKSDRAYVKELRKLRPKGNQLYLELSKKYPNAAKTYDLNAVVTEGVQREFGKGTGKGEILRAGLEPGQVVEEVRRTGGEVSRRTLTVGLGGGQTSSAGFFTKPPTQQEQERIRIKNGQAQRVEAIKSRTEIQPVSPFGLPGLPPPGQSVATLPFGQQQTQRLSNFLQEDILLEGASIPAEIVSKPAEILIDTLLNRDYREAEISSPFLFGSYSHGSSLVGPGKDEISNFKIVNALPERTRGSTVPDIKTFDDLIIDDQKLKDLAYGVGETELARRKEGQAKAEATFIINEETRKLQDEYTKEIQKEFNKLQSDINAGRISAYTANQKLNKKSDELLAKIETKWETQVIPKVNKNTEGIFNEFKKELKSPSAKRITSDLAIAGLSGAAIAGTVAAASIIPGVGSTLGVSFGASVLRSTPDIITGLKEEPLRVGPQLVGELGGFIGGAILFKKVGGKLKVSERLSEAKINEQLSRVDAVVSQKGTIVELKDLRNKYEFNEGQLNELTILAAGEGVRIIEKDVRLQSKEGYSRKDWKDIPKVEGKLLEFVDSQGNVIDSISLGTFISKQKGKVYAEAVVNRLDLLIEEEFRAKAVSKTLRAEWKNNKWEGTDKVETIEDIQFQLEETRTPTGYGEVDIGRLISGRSIGKVVEKGKPTKQELGAFENVEAGIGSLFGLKARQDIGVRREGLRESITEAEGKKGIGEPTITDFFSKEMLKGKQKQEAELEISRGKVDITSDTGIYPRIGEGTISLTASEVATGNVIGQAFSSQKAKPSKRGESVGDIFGTKEKPAKPEKVNKTREESRKRLQSFSNTLFQKSIAETPKEGRVGEEFPLIVQPEGRGRSMLGREQTQVPTGLTGEGGILTSFKSFAGERAKAGQPTKPGFRFGLGLRSDLGEQERPLFGFDLGIGELPSFSSAQITKQETIPSVKVDSLTSSIQKLQQDLKIDQKVPEVISPGIGVPNIKIPTPEIKIRPIFDFEFESSKKNKRQAYDVLVKEGKTYKKVNKKKLNLSQALSKGAREVDTTPAVTFKVKPTKGKISKEQSKKVDPYYSDNQFKFRQFSSSPVKGIKKALPQRTFVEKRGYRFDLGTERNLKSKASIAKRRNTGGKIF